MMQIVLQAETTELPTEVEHQTQADDKGNNH